MSETSGMSDPVYKTVEITGTSTVDVSTAVQNAVEKAAQSLRNIDWFEVKGIRGSIADGAIQQFQATVKIGFRLD
jgi:flavin-binding protein dodecin